MKTILLPIDFSESARNAAAYVLNLFRYERCEFIVLHCCSYLMPEADPWSSRQSRRSAADAAMHHLLQELRQAYPNPLHRFAGSVEEGPLLSAVDRHITTQNLSCIAVGTHGKTYSKKVIYGSSTRELIEGVKNCPLLVIPGKVKYSPIREVVLPSDFHFEPQPAELEFLKELLQKTGASLHILHIRTASRLRPDQEKNQQLLTELLQQTPPELHYLTDVSIPEGIYSFTEQRGSDLLVFINKKKRFLDNLFLENREDFKENYFKMPLLYIHYDSIPKNIPGTA